MKILNMITLIPMCRKEISSPQDVIKAQEEKVAACKAVAEDAEAEYQRKEVVLNATYEQVRARRGTYEERLNEVLDSIGVQRQAYHSQCFVGNHCKQILKHTESLLEVLPENEFRNN